MSLREGVTVNPQFAGKPVTGTAIFGSVARTDDTAKLEIQNDSHTALIVTLDITAVTATPSLLLKIEGQDPGSGSWYSILTSAAKTTVSTTTLRVSRQIAASANLIAQDILPERIRIWVDHSNTDSATYTVGAVLAD